MNSKSFSEIEAAIKAGVVAPHPLISDIIGSSSSTPWLRLHSNPASNDYRLGYEGSTQARLPHFYSPTGVRYGNQNMVLVKGMLVNNRKADFVDPYSGLGHIIGSKARLYALTQDPEKFAFKLHRDIRTWSTLHLQDLNAAGGQLNIGAIPTIARRARLGLNDGGEMASRMDRLKKSFMNSVLGNEDNNPQKAYEAFRDEYVKALADKLRTAGPSGNQINLAGIKESSFQLLHRFDNTLGQYVQDSIMNVNVGSPDEFQPFGQLSMGMPGKHHYNNYIATRVNQKISKRSGHAFGGFDSSFTHPLVAGSSYAQDLAEMSRMTGMSPRSFGTTIRADTGFIHGPKAGLAWSAIAGDSGAVLTSGRMVSAVAESTRGIQYSLEGVHGIPSLTNGRFHLTDEMLAVPGLKELLADRNAAPLVFGDRGFRINGKKLGTFEGGAKGKSRSLVGKSNYITKIERLEKGIRVTVNTSRLSVQDGLGFTTSGVKGTLGMGAKLRGMNKGSVVDVLAYGMKWGDPEVMRERMLSHYASRLTRSGKKGLEHRLGVLAELTGTSVGKTSFGHLYLHTGGSSYMDDLTPEAFNERFGEGLQAKLSARLGKSASYYAPKTRALSRLELANQMVGSGKMSRSEALEYIEREGIRKGDVMMTIFEGQNTRLRSTWFSREKFRVRAKKARTYLSTLQDVRGSVSPEVQTLIDKAMGVVGGNLKSIEDFSKFSIAATAAPLYGEDAMKSVMEKSGGKIFSRRLKDIRDPAFFAEFKNQLDAGTISPEMMDKVLGKFGFQENHYGMFLDLSGTDLEKVAVHTGARSGTDAAARLSNHVFLPNPLQHIPELRSASVTGFAGDIAVMPRRVVEEGLTASQKAKLNTRAAIFNLVEELLNPNATHGALSKRLMFSAMALRDSLAGSKGHISRGKVSGFKGARLRARQLGTLGMNEIGMSRSAIKKHFGEKAGTLGAQMLADLDAGRSVFTNFDRDPVQSAQQIQTVRLKLIDNKFSGLTKKSKRLIDGKTVSDVSDTIFVGNVPVRAGQGDLDTDTMQAWLQTQNGLTYAEQQKILSARHALAEGNMKPYGAMLRQQLMAADEKARIAVGSYGPTSDILATLTGGHDKYAQVIAAHDTDLFKSMGITGEVDAATRQAVGSVQNLTMTELIGTTHSYAAKHMRTLETLAGHTNHFKISKDALAKLMEQQGVSGAKIAEQADLVRLIYGFLKKGGTYSVDTMAIVAMMKEMKNVSIGSQKYTEMASKMAKHLQYISKGMSQSGTAWYAFNDGKSVNFAEEAARLLKGGIDDESFYRYRSEEMLKHARLTAQLEGKGLSVDAALTATRRPRSIISGIMDAITGTTNTPITGGEAGTEEIMSLASRYSSIDERTVASTASKAASGVGNAMSGAAQVAHEAMSKVAGSKNWGEMKAVGIGAAVFAGALALSNRSSDPEPVDSSMPGPSMPPSPILGSPDDGIPVVPIARGNRNARIERVTGQRRHFGTIDDVALPPSFNVMDSTSGRENPLSRASLTPRTASEARAKRSYNQDF